MTAAEKTFIDTNILVYAYDNQDITKHTIAHNLFKEYWKEPPFPSISIQVLQECFINLTKKNVPADTVALIVESFLEWNVINNDAKILKEGIVLSQQMSISFWDALIVAAAKAAGARYLLSEDLAHKHIYAGITVINPFIK